MINIVASNVHLQVTLPIPFMTNNSLAVRTIAPHRWIMNSTMLIQTANIIERSLARPELVFV
jgi:hypothetical protein